MQRLQPLKDLAPEALREHFRSAGLPAYRADQVLGWVYRRGVGDFERMSDLPAELRGQLALDWSLRALDVQAVRESRDGTRKLLFRAPDGAALEAVLIPEERRNTLCVSTQVGCPLACSFCATGAAGFTRNLSAGEIVDQVLHARALLPEDERITNLVFMGMGEPLLNMPALLESIDLLTHPKAFAMAPRRITVSTAGVVPQIPRLLEETSVNLAVSLHATTDRVRDELVPLNRRFPLDVLLGTLRADERLSRRRPVFFEYTLMDGINDSPEDARRLPGLLRGIPAKLNVIPMNAHADARERPPSDERVARFTQELHRAGMRVTLRRNRGADIEAACGQLAARDAQAAGSDAEPVAG